MAKYYQPSLFREEPRLVGEDKPATPEVPPAAQPVEPMSVDEVNWDEAGQKIHGIQVKGTNIRITGVDRRHG